MGANVAAALPLQACQGITFRGVTLMGSSFWVEHGDPLITDEPSAVKKILNGRDLTEKPRQMHAIDFYGLEQNEARDRFPNCYQRVLLGVKPERDQSQRESYRERWWQFAETRPAMRQERHTPDTERKCPACGSAMALRTAKAGAQAGKQFWVCSTFPKCRVMQNLQVEQLHFLVANLGAEAAFIPVPAYAHPHVLCNVGISPSPQRPPTG
ncbi:MAG: topoisomerase DNA-binding C4 zinc finger domain-containing protein [Burkholderiaceae bacterium]|nr:topoisomerase DNA-binding C4 zinc finger domain-containing protein [Burkholderiaceae bacterium]